MQIDKKRDFLYNYINMLIPEPPDQRLLNGLNVTVP